MWLWALLPILMVAIGNVGILVVCVVAAENGSINITKELPFLSECADHYPQGSYINQVMNTCSFLGICIVVIRFLLVKNFGYYAKTNIASLVFGLLFSFGASLMSNFGESGFFNFHFAASVFFFYGSMVFFWLQLFLIYHAEPSRERCFIVPALAICCIILTALCFAIYSLGLKDTKSEAAVCEIICNTLLFSMFAFFIPEFSRIDCLHITVQRRALQNDQKPALAENIDCQ